MATAESVFPKVGNDPVYASELNMYGGFGDGTDGAFSETASATTDLVQGTVYQYTSFTLGADHTISAASTSDKPIIILVQGDVVIDGTIDLAGKGAIASYNAAANQTTRTNWGSIGMEGTNGPPGGRSGVISLNFIQNQKGVIINGTSGGDGALGGGGGGCSSIEDGEDGVSGSGTTSAPGANGVGGCSILIICGGTLTFGAASVIDVSGTDGANGGGGDDGGGGGGGSGDILIFHHGAKTDNGVSTDVTGGTGGTGNAGGGNGGDGGDGQEKIVDWNTILW